MSKRLLSAVVIGVLSLTAWANQLNPLKIEDLFGLSVGEDALELIKHPNAIKTNDGLWAFPLNTQSEEVKWVKCNILSDSQWRPLGRYRLSAILANPRTEKVAGFIALLTPTNGEDAVSFMADFIFQFHQLARNASCETDEFKAMGSAICIPTVEGHICRISISMETVGDKQNVRMPEDCYAKLVVLDLNYAGLSDEEIKANYPLSLYFKYPTGDKSNSSVSKGAIE
jgi:hypothetical protein